MEPDSFMGPSSLTSLRHVGSSRKRSFLTAQPYKCFFLFVGLPVLFQNGVLVEIGVSGFERDDSRRKHGHTRLS
jgi:hypothetical protein